VSSLNTISTKWANKTKPKHNSKVYHLSFTVFTMLGNPGHGADDIARISHLLTFPRASTKSGPNSNLPCVPQCLRVNNVWYKWVNK
jgi:hypothetical protein